MSFFSFIIPVYNRPAEIAELLRSFTQMEVQGIPYEIIIVEDGSDQKCESAIRAYKDRLPLSYFYKENTGPGATRNYGMSRAKGDFFIILDSDVWLPVGYLKSVDVFLEKNNIDSFGGADKAHKSFSAVQKAINFSMTSFLTTGGIRGSKNSVEKFKPRSFNMGISKRAFQKTGGFSTMAVGEDLDISIRLSRAGFNTAFIEGAFVYHKRRVSWKSFCRQVYNFGKGRPILDRRYKCFSLFSVFPSLFSIGLVIAIILFLFGIRFFVGLYIFYFLLIFVGSGMIYKSIKIGGYAVWATIVQFYSYGWGYLEACYQVIIRGRKPEEAFPNLFFGKK